MKNIRAKVNPRLLQKADRLFTGSLRGRIIELLQNARRAGAGEVVITNEDGWVTVRDNGEGIADFASLLDLGGSGWDDATELSEDPAGVGVFCLAPRKVCIRSKGKFVEFGSEGWTGKAVEVQDDPESLEGTEICFQDEPWSKESVEPNAVFTGLKVTVDGKVCTNERFVSNKAVYLKKLGCRVEVMRGSDLSDWHSMIRRNCDFGNVLVNFHGQVINLTIQPVSDRSLFFLIDLTGEPTDIRLMLPARTRLVENEAFEQIKSALEIEAYRFYQRQEKHSLYYDEYLRGKELGVELPEAEPTFRTGLLHGDELEPIEVSKPDDFPLSKCYRLGEKLRDWALPYSANVHLLTVLGKHNQPFVPVDICPRYDGYSWAKLPMIDKVKVKASKVIHRQYLWGKELVCVDSLQIEVSCSNGKQFFSNVCMAERLADKNGKVKWAPDEVLITPEARKQMDTQHIWFHLGGYNEDGDTYDTQDYQFQQELDVFWREVLGPDEPLRAEIMETLRGVSGSWKKVVVSCEGLVTVYWADGTEKMIKPPPEVLAAP